MRKYVFDFSQLAEGLDPGELILGLSRRLESDCIAELDRKNKGVYSASTSREIPLTFVTTAERIGWRINC